MKHLFIIRHGSYDIDDLTQFGVKQIEEIAEEMKTIVGDNSNGHYLLTSTAPRAKQTAEIIAKEFDLKDFDRNEELWTGGGYISREGIETIDRIIEPHTKNY
ncbi:hypothetical protein CL617_05420 [archaeon]|nr:hypothetical protein [archaeon]|tara:strand:+ start:4051 stop:4356 length:306 start_codon:yes stop_codon:yes gene_type:complete